MDSEHSAMKRLGLQVSTDQAPQPARNMPAANDAGAASVSPGTHTHTEAKISKHAQ
jgi:hypothetical protein